MIDPYQQYMYSYPHKTAYGPLSNVHLRDYVHRLSAKENSLYFHIPFCQYKCGYCNLFSAAGRTEQYMTAYVDAMERQSRQLAEILPPDVFFLDLTLGGGTPLLLPLHLLERIFKLAEVYFGFLPRGHSVVVETSPNQTTERKLALLKEKGVTRISIGVQSFQETELEALHRFHSVQAAKKALGLIRQMNFDCLNIDLIYGINGQTVGSLMDSLKQALEFEPEELFVYPLYIQPGTFLYRQGAAGRNDRMHKINMMQMYEQIRKFLRQAGYQPCSMRRFIKMDKQSKAVDRHNQDISVSASLCGFGNTLSVGCGGRSYIGNLHFCTPYGVGRERCLSILDDYMEQDDYLQITHGFLLSEEEEKRRYVIRHILFGSGIDCKDYKKNFGKEVFDEFPQLLAWEQEGFAALGRGFISLTEKGFALSDYLGPQLISEAVRKKCDHYVYL